MAYDPPQAAMATDTQTGDASPPDVFGFTPVPVGRSIFDGVWREASRSRWPSNVPELDALTARLGRLSLRQRVDETNAWINARVAYARDPVLFDHHWGNLAQVLARRRGEREDIAIAKLQLLAAVGVPRRDMFLLLVRDASRIADDALLLVRIDNQICILDSKQDQLVDGAQRGRYVPVLAFGADGRWIYGTRSHTRSIPFPQTEELSFAAVLAAGR